MRNNYFLLRHGKTIYQTKKRKFVYPPINKQGNIGLIAESKRRLKETAKRIKKEKIDLIYSSDILRTRQTAGIVAKELGLKIHFDKRLRDLNHGIWSGRIKKEFHQAFSDPQKRFKTRLKKGESWNDIKKRLSSFLKDVEGRYKNKNILVVSHGDTLWLLEGIIKNMNNQMLLDEIFVKKNFIQPEEFRKL